MLLIISMFGKRFTGNFFLVNAAYNNAMQALCIAFIVKYIPKLNQSGQKIHFPLLLTPLFGIK